MSRMAAICLAFSVCAGGALAAPGADDHKSKHADKHAGHHGSRPTEKSHPAGSHDDKKAQSGRSDRRPADAHQDRRDDAPGKQDWGTFRPG